MKIRCDQRKETLNLTFSAPLVIQDDAKSSTNLLMELQRNAVNKLRPQSRISTYLYPRDTLHFSILNLTTFDLGVDFASGRRFVEVQSWYKQLLKEGFVTKTLTRITELFEKTEFQIEKIYTDNDQINNSLTLNLSCGDKKEGLKEVESELKEEIYKKELKIPIEGFGVKPRGEFFALNLLRFFGPPNSIIEDCDEFYQFVYEKNKQLSKDKPVILHKLKPAFVISDAYLSNANSVVE